MIKRYDSTMALLQDYIKTNAHGNSYSRNYWYNNESESDTLRYAEIGNTSLVPSAEALLSQLDSIIETPRLVWERSVAGPFCRVPDVLAGLPTPMRRQIHQRDEHNPITLLSITTSSAGVDAKVLEKRGTTILALVIALSRVRPVTLHQVAILDGPKDRTDETIITSEINTHPLDLATACYVLTSAGFARRLTYGLARTLNGFTGGWPKGYWNGEIQYYKSLAQRLAPDPTKCLVIGAARLDDQLLREPLVWLNKQIERFTTEQEDFVQ